MAKAKTSPDKDAPPVPAPAPPKGAGAAPAVEPKAEAPKALPGYGKFVALENIPRTMIWGLGAGNGRVERGTVFQMEDDMDAERAAYLVKIGYAKKA